jgi:hypothetical protein
MTLYMNKHFYLNIKNYNKSELEDLLELPKHYDESIIDPYEQSIGSGNTQWFSYPILLPTVQTRIGNNSTTIGGCAIWIPFDCQVDRIAFNVSIGEAGSQVDAYLYDRPIDETNDSNQLASLGSALTTTSGVKEISFTPISLTRGWYIVGLQGTTTGAYPALISLSAYWQSGSLSGINRSNGLWGPITVPPPSSHKWNLIGLGTSPIVTIRAIVP